MITTTTATWVNPALETDRPKSHFISSADRSLWIPISVQASYPNKGGKEQQMQVLSKREENIDCAIVENVLFTKSSFIKFAKQ